jgi:DNA modification methylase
VSRATSSRAVARPPRPVLYGDLSSWALIGADCLELLEQLPATSVDVVITDPPYGLAFKREAWDGGELAEPRSFQDFCQRWATLVRRALRPGGHLVSFGTPRTFHRLVSGVEDAGLEIRDALLWLHAAGVPKSRRLSGGIGTSLKPTYEPILLARTPLVGGSAPRNIARHGTGGLNIEATRLPRTTESDREGYWPTHLLLAHAPDCPGEAPDGRGCTNGCLLPAIDRLGPTSPEGGLSRLFYAAKTSRDEREAGCERLGRHDDPVFSHGGRGRKRANRHPTVKPLDLMRWLVRLTAPPSGVVLDPFAGSGSTGCAAVLEGRQFIGIERDGRYLPIAQARLSYWTGIARQGAAALAE